MWNLPNKFESFHSILNEGKHWEKKSSFLYNWVYWWRPTLSRSHLCKNSWVNFSLLFHVTPGSVSFHSADSKIITLLCDVPIFGFTQQQQQHPLITRCSPIPSPSFSLSLSRISLFSFFRLTDSVFCFGLCNPHFRSLCPWLVPSRKVFSLSWFRAALWSK